MKTIRYFGFALFALVTFQSSLYAQSSWSVQQCIDYALEHNLTIKLQELNTENEQLTLTQSYFNFVPTLNGFASNNYYYGRSIDPYTNQFTEKQIRSNSLSLSSSMPLFEGLRLQNMLSQSKLNYLSAKYDLQKVKNDIVLNVVTYYLQVLYNKELYDISKEARDATLLQRDRTKRMEELGAVSKGSLLDIESQLATDEVNVVTAQSQYDQSLLSLKQLLDLDTLKDFQIISPVLPVPAINVAYSDVEAIYLAALNNQPDVKSSEYKVTSAEKGISISKAAIYPRITANGSLSTTYSTSSQRIKEYIVSQDPLVIGYTSSFDTVYSLLSERTPVLEKTPFNDQLRDNLGKSIGFTMTIPLFNNWNTRTGIKRARLYLDQTRYNNDILKKTLYKNIQQAVADASTAFNKYDAGEKSVAAKQEALTYNQQRYDLGLISTYDYFIAKNNLARAKAELLQARYDFIFRIKVLDFYMGKPLAF